MSEAKVHLETVDGGVTIARLDRPPVNALNPEWLAEIESVFEALERDDSVRAVVIGGAGKTLCAGMDLKELESFDRDAQRATVQALNSTFASLYRFAKPLICAAHGAAIAGGLFFVLVSDYRVAGERAVFGLAEMRVGLRFPIGPLTIAASELSPSACRRLVLGAGNHSAPSALALGVVDEVVAGEQVLERATAVARDYATLPGQTFTHTKRALRAGALSRLTTDAPDPMLSGWFTDETQQAIRGMLASLG